VDSCSADILISINFDLPAAGLLSYSSPHKSMEKFNGIKYQNGILPPCQIEFHCVKWNSHLME
jgi:hypothetical protein